MLRRRAVHDRRDGAPAAAAIVVEDLHRRYGDVEAVAGLSFSVRRGEIFALLGPNGAGKTTTIEILEGYRRRSAGTVRVLGTDPERGGRALRERIGIVLQAAGLDDELTVRETVELYASCYATPRALPELLGEVDLEDRRDRRVLHLSGGERRRLDLALALVGDPELVFLDEPTTGLDPAARRRAWGTIAGLRRAGRAIVLTSHYMDEVQQLADRVLVMARGRAVATGSPAALRAGRGRPTTIAFQLPDGATLPPDLAMLLRPGARACAEGEAAIGLCTDEPTRVLHRLTGWALAQGFELRGLSVVEPSLEDVYLELTEEPEAVLHGS
ncbi:ABC transporter ATP-binding protein [Baekduia soli]|uniref:ABC transporter ATP-binding protein n=1 Tax=Baekduia soli TaxID=496014 RepID=A0A5B8U5Y9_9ACTN|nr:ABC transporter ATP-binding protein [Baekduia soli]QEC48305.1 ABC transporter ATP-binding protein [Baekduia soli]